tara:strand:+ start:138 stop:440 length:303 start_codon:yes stop_codon:yes gene_type:complete
MSIALDKEFTEEERLRELKKTRKSVLQLKHAVQDIDDNLTAISTLVKKQYGEELNHLFIMLENLTEISINLHHKILFHTKDSKQPLKHRTVRGSTVEGGL